MFSDGFKKNVYSFSNITHDLLNKHWLLDESYVMTCPVALHEQIYEQFVT